MFSNGGIQQGFSCMLQHIFIVRMEPKTLSHPGRFLSRIDAWRLGITDVDPNHEYDDTTLIKTAFRSEDNRQSFLAMTV